MGAARLYNAPMIKATTKPASTATPGGDASGAYAYQSHKPMQPTPAQVRAARLLCQQTQATAAALVHKSDSARWRQWERTGQAGRVIDLATWELYLIKSGLRVNT